MHQMRMRAAMAAALKERKVLGILDGGTAGVKRRMASGSSLA